MYLVSVPSLDMGNAESHHDGPAHSEKQRIGGQILTTPVTYTDSQHVTQNEQIVPADNGKQENDDVMICTGNNFENRNGHLHNGNASDTMSIGKQVTKETKQLNDAKQFTDKSDANSLCKI